MKSAEDAPFVSLIEVRHTLGVKRSQNPTQIDTNLNRSNSKLQSSSASNQILTASYDHYFTFVSGPACKHKNPIWRTAAVFNIVRVAIIQPYIDQFWWNLVCRWIIIMVPGSGLVIKTGTGSTNEPWAAVILNFIFAMRNTCAKFGMLVENRVSEARKSSKSAFSSPRWRRTTAILKIVKIAITQPQIVRFC